MKIITQSLPPATVGEAYSARLDAADGLEPYVWALDGASDPLPPGLSLSTAGVLSGTPFGAPQTFTNLIFQATDATPTALDSSPLSLLVQPGAYKQATAYLMEDKINDMVTRIFGTGDQVNRFEFMRHFFRSRDVGSGETTYLRKLQFLHESGEIQSPLLTNAGLAAGNSVRAALILIDSLLTGAANPFTVLPPPSGDTTGVTDTAALNAVWTNGTTKEWLVIPPEVTAAAPYYINANVTNGGSMGFRLLAAYPRQAFHFLDNTTGTPHTPGTPWEIRNLVQIDGVGMGTGVRPVRFGGVTMEIVNSMISISAYNLFGDGIGYIRESEIRIADHTARIAAAAADLSLFENDILFTGAANNGQKVLIMSGAANTNVRIANNKISGTLGVAALIFDLTAGVATSLTLLGPNIYRDTAAVSTYTPYSTVGNVGGITVSPQAAV
jgi:hypothetical protein